MAKAMPTATLGGRIMTAEQLMEIDIFKDVPEKQLRRFPGTVSLREFKAGEVVCRQGEGGTTAFYIRDGDVRIFIDRRADGRDRKSSGGLIAAVGRLFGQQRIAQPQTDPNALVPIDATVDLTYGKMVSTLHAGDMFGEMSCLNLAPRSATVVARTDCRMIEILRNMYELLQKSKAFKQRMDAEYRKRALSGHLRNVPALRDVSDDDLRDLEQRVELVTHKAGDTIFRQGDDADAMYIIRLGQVKVAEAAPGGERTLAYLTRGDYFGEIGPMHGQKRTATCTAADHPIIEGGRKRRPGSVELVRIAAEDFRAVLARYPSVKQSFTATAERRVAEKQRRTVSAANAAPSQRVEELGLMQGQNLLLIDLTKCTRCDQCVDACVAAHEDGATRLIREGPRYGNFLVPSSCRMCRDPACMIGCPVGSIRRAENLQIRIENWCIGCGNCANQCPYDSIQMHSLEEFGERISLDLARRTEGGETVPVTERAVVCDQCSNLPAGPACVNACPHDATQRVDAAEFFAAEHGPLSGGAPLAAEANGDGQPLAPSESEPATARASEARHADRS